MISLFTIITHENTTPTKDTDFTSKDMHYTGMEKLLEVM
jgi:hypothetical protein